MKIIVALALFGALIMGSMLFMKKVATEQPDRSEMINQKIWGTNKVVSGNVVPTFSDNIK